MQEKRIALLIHALHGGGAERLMAQLAQRWANQGHEIHLVTWAATETDTYPIPDSAVRHGLDLMRQRRSTLGGAWANWKRVQAMRRCLRSIDPDFVLSFSDQMNIVALEAAGRLDCPVWISEHSNPEAQRLSRLWEVWRGRSYPRCAGCVALTESIAQFMTRWIPEDKLHVIPPAITPPETLDTKSVGDPSRMKTLLCLGRLSFEKGQDVLLDAWELVAEKLPDWQLELVGDGPLRPQLESRVETLPRVSLLGWTDDPWSKYAQADLYVLPSRYEGFPVALLEAMSQGVCCITTDCSSALQELGKEAAGLSVVPVDASGELASAIVSLARSEALRSEQGALGKSASQAYRWQCVGPKWDAILPG